MRRHKLVLAVVFIALLAVVCLAFGLLTRPCLAADLTQDQAVARALQYVGLQGETGLTVSATSETAPPDNVPFLRIGGRATWRVRLGNVTLRVADPQGRKVENPTIHELDVVLDRSTGALLKIVSPLPTGLDASTQGSLAKREDRLSRQSQRFELPAPAMAIPGVSFLQALQGAYVGLGGVGTAKQIEALYVGVRAAPRHPFPHPLPCEKEACLRWVVTLRYLPFAFPLLPLGGQIPKDYVPPPYTHWQHYIDANTGQWLEAGNVP
jgi:hypothetical protein